MKNGNILIETVTSLRSLYKDCYIILDLGSSFELVDTPNVKGKTFESLEKLFDSLHFSHRALDYFDPVPNSIMNQLKSVNPAIKKGWTSPI